MVRRPYITPSLSTRTLHFPNGARRRNLYPKHLHEGHQKKLIGQCITRGSELSPNEFRGLKVSQGLRIDNASSAKQATLDNSHYV